MRTLKLIAIALATATASVYAAAQTDVMEIKLQNGATAQFDLQQISEVAFNETDIDSEPQTLRGVEYVDLGLSSGLLWATCNYHATSIYDYGTYFAWGEDYPKSTYDIFKGKWCKYTVAGLIAAGVTDEDGNLMPDYDVVTINFGSPWRIPTKDEWQELVDCCTWTWVGSILDGTTGAYVTGPNGNYIFLSAGGNYHGFQGEHGNYWTATTSVEDDRAWAFYFNATSKYSTKELRGTGLTIRPVADAITEDM